MTGGAPANGKSTFLDSRSSKIPKKILNVNSDLIKEKLPEYELLTGKKDPRAAAFVHEESSALSKRIAAKAIKDGRPMLLDTVGDGSIDSMAKKVSGFRKNGHRISADYVTLDTDLSVKLAEARARKTGREVPLDYVLSMNKEVSRLLPQYVERGFFDELRLWDTNEQGVAKLIFQHIDGVSTVIDESLYARFLAKGR